MRENYDFSNSVKNPYFEKVKEQITIPIDEETLGYFKSLSAQNGIPYQNLIHLYLRDCAQQQKQLSVIWS
ncbi:MAG: antitoxin [Candidatus Parabeggiatoa sp.]|nr:antitoxin [Candidatus Parabeggiatoa sp.]